VIQKVVPFRRQGRVFGFAQAFESSAAPITSFLIAPLAQFWVIPYMETTGGHDAWGWLLGDGDARGIALIFLIGGIVMVIAALLAFTTRSYRLLSEYFAGQHESVKPTEPPAPSTTTEAISGADQT
ncbi:MAG: MFS transporter, partial [Propioniciclava sp.]